MCGLDVFLENWGQERKRVLWMIFNVQHGIVTPFLSSFACLAHFGPACPASKHQTEESVVLNIRLTIGCLSAHKAFSLEEKRHNVQRHTSFAFKNKKKKKKKKKKYSALI
eukprot:Trichotokara_eunicae@DN2273_c0_g1_i2.p1